MSIDRMQRVTILAPRRKAGPLIERLQKLGIIHLEDACGRLRTKGRDTAPTGNPSGGDKVVPASPALSSPALSSETVDAKVRQLEAILHVLDTFAPVKKSFVQGLVSTPMRVKRDEMAQVVAQFDHEPLYFESMHALDELRDRERDIEAAEAEISALGCSASFRSTRATCFRCVSHTPGWARCPAECGTSSVRTSRRPSCSRSRNCLRTIARRKSALSPSPGTGKRRRGF